MAGMPHSYTLECEIPFCLVDNLHSRILLVVELQAPPVILRAHLLNFANFPIHGISNFVVGTVAGGALLLCGVGGVVVGVMLCWLWWFGSW